MSNKLKRLEKYAKSLKESLESPVPTKHSVREKEYVRFLQNQLDAVNKQILVLKQGPITDKL